jgi:hypothetical protein
MAVAMAMTVMRKLVMQKVIMATQMDTIKSTQVTGTDMTTIMAMTKDTGKGTTR